MDVERVAVDPQSGLVEDGSSQKDVSSLQQEITSGDISKWVQLAAQPQEATLFEWEQAESEQLKFNMAFELPVQRASAQFPASMLLNGVLGGYAHSKLFQNVREKASLAYYASSRWDSLSQRLIVQSGIAPENEARTRALVLEQIQAIADGQIDDDEWMQTIALLKNSMREREDDPFSWSEAMQMNRWSASRWTTKDLIAALDRVTREEVAALAQLLRLDLVYRYGKQVEVAGVLASADSSSSAGKAGDDNA
jgi:predicted Zn-dependent peptidase